MSASASRAPSASPSTPVSPPHKQMRYSSAISSSTDTLVSMKTAESAKKDPSILKPRKGGLLGWIWGVLLGAQSSTAAVGTSAIVQGASKTQLIGYVSKSVGIGYFFYKIADFINAVAKVVKKASLLRVSHLAQQVVSLGSATLAAVVSLGKFGWIAVRAASMMVAQLVFGALSLVKSLMAIIDIARFAKAKQRLQALSPQLPSAQLTASLKTILGDTKVMRSYLKDLFPNPAQLAQFNRLVNENPVAALHLIKQSNTQGLVREVVSLASNLLLGIGGIVSLFFPPIGLAITCIGAAMMALDWIIGKFLAKDAAKQLEAFSQTLTGNPNTGGPLSSLEIAGPALAKSSQD